MKQIKGSNRIDWKRQNKIALRNFNEACDFHDIVKTLLVRMLRREHPDTKNIPIYTEHNPEEQNENYPDIWMRIKRDIYVWEIQKNIDEQWSREIEKKHAEINLIIVPLEQLERESKGNINKLKQLLGDYVI